MPADIVSRFGRAWGDPVNNLFIAPQYESAVVDALEAAGWTCERDDALVIAASDRSFD
jgi:hypothetical protein